MNDSYVAGFFDGEGSAILGLNKTKSCKCGYQFLPRVNISQKAPDILYEIKNYFGFGNVAKHNKWLSYDIHRQSDIKAFISRIKDHTYIKRRQLMLMEEALKCLYGARPNIITRGNKVPPISKENLLRLADIVEELRKLHGYKRKNYVPIENVKARISRCEDDIINIFTTKNETHVKLQDEKEYKSPINYDYIAGLFDADGTVVLGVHRLPASRCGYQFMPHVTIGQKTSEILHKISSFLGFGTIIERKGICEYVIRRQNDLHQFIELMRSHVILKRKHLALLDEALMYLRPSAGGAQTIPTTHLLRLVEIVDEMRRLNDYKQRHRVSIEEIRKNIESFDEEAHKRRVHDARAIKLKGIEQLIELYQKEKKSTLEIGEIFGCSWGAVRKALIRLGVPLRTRSEAFKIVWEKRRS